MTGEHRIPTVEVSNVLVRVGQRFYRTVIVVTVGRGVWWRVVPTVIRQLLTVLVKVVKLEQSIGMLLREYMVRVVAGGGHRERHVVGVLVGTTVCWVTVTVTVTDTIVVVDSNCGIGSEQT